MARLNGTGGVAGSVTARAEQCKNTHVPGFIAARQFGVGFRFGSEAVIGPFSNNGSPFCRKGEPPCNTY